MSEFLRRHRICERTLGGSVTFAIRPEAPCGRWAGEGRCLDVCVNVICNKQLHSEGE